MEKAGNITDMCLFASLQDCQTRKKMVLCDLKKAQTVMEHFGAPRSRFSNNGVIFVLLDTMFSPTHTWTEMAF